MDDFAKRLKEARTAAGLSQAKTRALFSPPVPQRTYESWEMGTRTPPAWSVELILDHIRAAK